MTEKETGATEQCSRAVRKVPSAPEPWEWKNRLYQGEMKCGRDELVFSKPQGNYPSMAGPSRGVCG